MPRCGQNPTEDLSVAEPDPAKREPVPILDDPDTFAREFFIRQADRLPDPPLPKPKKPKRGTKPTLIVSNDPSKSRDTDEER